jgi:ribosomal protein L37AE/L43A
MKPLHQGPVTQCAQCGAAIIAPECSEHRFDRCVRNVWSCEVCGYQFENTVYFSAPKIQPELRGEDNERAAPNSWRRYSLQQ